MSFLDILPREILNEIFAYVVKSSDPVIMLYRDNVEKPFGRYALCACSGVSLAFLRTNKQIYHEFRDMVFQQNTFELDLSNNEHLDSLVLTRISSRFRSIKIFVDLGQQPSLGKFTLSDKLERLRTWKSLRSVTFHIPHIEKLLMERDQSEEGYVAYYEDLETLRKAARGPLSQIKISTSIGLGGDEEFYEKASTTIRRWYSTKNLVNPNLLLLEISAATQGQVLLCGDLYYRNGRLVQKDEPFKENLYGFRGVCYTFEKLRGDWCLKVDMEYQQMPPPTANIGLVKYRRSHSKLSCGLPENCSPFPYNILMNGK